MRTYAAISGDTWDSIAKKVYGKEKHADYLMANNFNHLDTLVFRAGVILSIPEKPIEENDDLPPWRR